jgi:hypothetical protein
MFSQSFMRHRRPDDTQRNGEGTGGTFAAFIEAGQTPFALVVAMPSV